MGNHIFPKVQKFPTSVGRFREIATNCLNTLAQLVKKSFLIYVNVPIVHSRSVVVEVDSGINASSLDCKFFMCLWR